MSGPGRAAPVLRAVAGTLFTALLVWVPLNFGSTRAGGSALLATGCTGATLLWAAAWGLGGPRPQVPAAIVFPATCLVVMLLPWSLGLYSPTLMAPFTQVHFGRVVARWPLSLVWPDPAAAIALVVARTAALLALVDLARERRWLLIFSGALVATAAAVAGLALAENYTHATGIYWRDEGRLPGNFCGTFFHHTSAGAYFNTAWPLAVALTWLAWGWPAPTRLTRAAAAAGAFATLALVAGHASHVSRFPQVAAVLVAPLLYQRLRLRRPRYLRSVVLALVAVAAVIALVSLTGRTGEIAARWQLVLAPGAGAATGPSPGPAEWPALMRADLFVPSPHSLGLFGVRLEAWRTALRSIAERPLTGHGPANWIGAASHHTVDPFVRTFYQFLQFAHQDTLQAAVEWGLPAALAWWALLGGALAAAWRPAAGAGRLPQTISLAAGCALLAVVLQAQLDFPLQIPAVAFNAVVLAALCWSARVPLGLGGPQALTP